VLSFKCGLQKLLSRSVLCAVNLKVIFPLKSQILCTVLTLKGSCIVFNFFASYVCFSNSENVLFPLSRSVKINEMVSTAGRHQRLASKSKKKLIEMHVNLCRSLHEK